MSLAWITDLHLDHLPEREYRRLVAGVMDVACDGLLITGDIADGPTVARRLEQLAHEISGPIYFILGNHDFYGSSIAEIRERVSVLSAGSEQLVYLNNEGVIELSPTTALIGHDGWADGRAADFMASSIVLNDYVLITELRECDKGELKQKLHQLGDEAAENLRGRLLEAMKRYGHVVMAIHQPPYIEACLYENKMSGPEWAPHFVCQAVGTMISEVMAGHPDKELIVLCGHSHHDARYKPLPNVDVICRGAEYGVAPVVDVIELEKKSEGE